MTTKKIKAVMSSQTFLWLTMAAAILTALSGQAQLFPASWNGIISILGIVGTAINGVLLRTPFTTSEDEEPKDE